MMSLDTNATALRGVLFDMDGVLVDSYEAWFHLMNGAARDLGYPPISRTRFHEVWGQGPDLDVEIFFTRHTIPQVERYYDEHFRNHSGYVTTNPLAGEVFSDLRRRGLKVGVITNTPSSIARKVLDHAHLEPDVLVGGTDVPRGKPAPDMVFKALDSLGLTPGEAVLIGDSPFDRQAAAAAGLRFISYNITSSARLEQILDDLGSGVTG